MGLITQLLFWKGLNVLVLVLSIFGVWPSEVAWLHALMIAFLNHVLIKIGYYK